MPVPAGRHRVGADRDRLTLRTARDGLAASVGHDLTIDVTRWQGELAIAPDGTPSGLDVRIDLTSLAVREGTGGVKPLTGRDRRDIGSNARKVLSADRHPEAVFGDAKFEPGANGGGTISGTLTLAGRPGPFRLQVAESGENHFRATGTVVQSAFGIKPYSGFFGALKVRDAVEIEVDVDFSQPEGTP
ncbi:MAG TPA: YceI family protein [Streptosporangiaceae bacterium]|nr:YceI family protein [Streptosporangiaceae bacterium]